MLARTYGALVASAREAGVDVFPIAWTPGAKLWFARNGVACLFGGSLQNNVRRFLADLDPVYEVVGRVDEDILVAPSTLTVLLDHLEGHDAVSAWVYAARPAQDAWAGRVTFGACHFARRPSSPVYAEFFPTWAAGVDTLWVDAGATNLGATARIDRWESLAVQAISAQSPPVQISLQDYGGWPTPSLTGFPGQRLTRALPT